MFSTNTPKHVFHCSAIQFQEGLNFPSMCACFSLLNYAVQIGCSTCLCLCVLLAAELHSPDGAGRCAQSLLLFRRRRPHLTGPGTSGGAAADRARPLPGRLAAQRIPDPLRRLQGHGVPSSTPARHAVRFP